ncbi:MAG: hypothetical protein NW207_01185 [Cytophagales bacterium]|nr:hypothetical protein [Cytophagales bacterium]
MEKSKFIQILQNRVADTHDVAALEDIQKKYPFSSIPHVLIAKSFADKEHLNSPQKLKRASLFSVDRSYLYKFITEKKTLLKTEPKAEETPKELQQDLQFELKKTQMLHEIQENLAKLRNNVSNELDTVSQKITESKSQKPIENVPIEPKIGLKYYVHDSRFAKGPIHSTSSAIDDYLNFINKFEKNKISEKDEKESIIKNFLRSTPSLSRTLLPENEENKKDLSDESLATEDDFLTENMANIYLKQNKIKKALEVYEKLMLKYPEKSSYFALKIESLKN